MRCSGEVCFMVDASIVDASESPPPRPPDCAKLYTCVVVLEAPIQFHKVYRTSQLWCIVGTNLSQAP